MKCYASRHKVSHVPRMRLTNRLTSKCYCFFFSSSDILSPSSLFFPLPDSGFASLPPSSFSSSFPLPIFLLPLCLRPMFPLPLFLVCFSPLFSSAVYSLLLAPPAAPPLVPLFSAPPNFENCETEAFCNFETTQIQEAFSENQRRLDVLNRELKNPITFQGFNTQEIRTYKKINKNRTEVLKGAGHSKTGIPLVYEQVFPKMHKLVTFGCKTITSLINNQGSKITPGLFDFSRKTNFSSVDDHTSLKPPGFGQSRKFMPHELNDAVLQLFSSFSEVLY